MACLRTATDALRDAYSLLRAVGDAVQQPSLPTGEGEGKEQLDVVRSLLQRLTTGGQATSSAPPAVSAGGCRGVEEGEDGGEVLIDALQQKLMEWEATVASHQSPSRVLRWAA